MNHMKIQVIWSSQVKKQNYKKFKIEKTNIETKENISVDTKENSKSKQEESRKQEIMCNILDVNDKINIKINKNGKEGQYNIFI